MTTKIFIKRALKMCEPQLKVDKINFEHSINIKEKSESMELTIFYTSDSLKAYTNFTVRVYSDIDNYSLNGLLLELKSKLIRMTPITNKTKKIEVEPYFEIAEK